MTYTQPETELGSIQHVCIVLTMSVDYNNIGRAHYPTAMRYITRNKCVLVVSGNAAEYQDDRRAGTFTRMR